MNDTRVMAQNETLIERTLSNLAGAWRDIAQSAARTVGRNGGKLDAVLKQADFIDGQIIATDSRLRIINNASPAETSIPGEVDPRHIIVAVRSPSCTSPSTWLAERAALP